MEYVIGDTKISSGTREIPMTDDVYPRFQRIIDNRLRTEPMINGRCGFLYLDKDGMNPKALNICTHLGFEDAQEELKRVANSE